MRPENIIAPREAANDVMPQGKDMSVVFGTGEFKYHLEPYWAKLPEGWDFGEVASVAVDRQDRIYVFSRSEHPLTVWDREGNFLKSWGEGMFTRPHGLHIGPD